LITLHESAHKVSQLMNWTCTAMDDSIDKGRQVLWINYEIQ